MALDTLVFSAAKVVLSAKGRVVDPLLCDPFVEKCVRYLNKEMDLYHLKTIMPNRKGEMIPVERVIVHDPEAAYQAYQSGSKRTISIINGELIFLDAVMLDYVRGENGFQGSQVYKPGNWVEAMFGQTNSIMREWNSLEDDNELQGQDSADYHPDETPSEEEDEL